jgi:hypothetical protein
MHSSSSFKPFKPTSAGRKYHSIPIEFVFFVSNENMLMLLVPVGIHFLLQSSSQVIKWYSILTKIELLLFLVHCTVLKDDDATLTCSLYSLDLDGISHTGNLLRPSALLMLALL